MRLDKWLWCARFYKTRALSAEAANGGAIRVNGVRATKAGLGVKIGDVLTFARGRRILVVEVVAFAERRGPAADAVTLYREIPEADADGGSAPRDGDPPDGHAEGDAAP